MLIVFGFDLIDRAGDTRQNDPPEGYSRRVFIDRINRFDAIIQHAEVITLPFDSAQPAAVTKGANMLGSYTIVDWIAGEHQTPFPALTANEQTALTNFLNTGGALFISGWEIGYELKNTTFYANSLRALTSPTMRKLTLPILRPAASLTAWEPSASTMDRMARTLESARNQLDNGTDFSREIVGFRLAGQLTFDPKLEGYASMGYQFRDDRVLGARQPNIYGNDTLADITLGMRWKLDKDWSLRPQVTYTDNRSNIPLYETKRPDVTIALRKELR